MSKRLVLNFQATNRDQWLGHASRRSSQVLAVCSLVIAVGLLMIVGVQIVKFRSELSTARATLERVQLVQLTRNRPIPTRTIVLSKQQLNAYNVAVQQLNTPWTALFDTLERTASGEVALVLIEPDSLRATVRVQAEAKKMDDLLNYAEALKRDVNVESVSLVKQETNERDSNRPVRLTLEARMRAPSRSGKES